MMNKINNAQKLVHEIWEELNIFFRDQSIPIKDRYEKMKDLPNFLHIYGNCTPLKNEEKFISLSYQVSRYEHVSIDYVFEGYFEDLAKFKCLPLMNQNEKGYYHLNRSFTSMFSYDEFITDIPKEINNWLISGYTHGKYDW